MTTNTPNFNNENFQRLIDNAPEEEVSHNLYFTHPDGTHEFIPKKDIHARFDDPYVEYKDENGDVVAEHLGPKTGKFESIGFQKHAEHVKKPDDYDPKQVEFGFTVDGSLDKDKKLKKPEEKGGIPWYEVD